MSKQDQILGSNLMPKEPNLLVKIALALFPILVASGIGFNVYLTQQVASLDKRQTAQEQWKDGHEKRVPEIVAQITKEREDADKSYRESTLRQVESAAAVQRESILAQLAAIQRDVLRIALILDIQRPKEPAAWKPSAGTKQDGDEIDRLLNR